MAVERCGKQKNDIVLPPQPPGSGRLDATTRRASCHCDDTGISAMMASMGKRRKLEKPFTVLFVEDDSQIRDSVAQLLASKGFVVLTADNGYAAMRTLVLRHVDVLFTDIVMPELDGIELAKRARHLQPGIEVMFVTGYAAKSHEALPLGPLFFKPLRAQQIAAEIRQLLSRSASG